MVPADKYATSLLTRKLYVCIYSQSVFAFLTWLWQKLLSDSVVRGCARSCAVVRGRARSCAVVFDVVRPRLCARSEVACMGRVQNALNGFRAIQDTIGLIQRQSEDVVREYLAFLAAMLRHANHMSQVAAHSYHVVYLFSNNHRTPGSILY